MPSQLHHKRFPIRRRSQEIKDIVEIGTVDTVQCGSIEVIRRHSVVHYISQCEGTWRTLTGVCVCSGLCEYPQTCSCSVRAGFIVRTNCIICIQPRAIPLMTSFLYIKRHSCAKRMPNGFTRKMNITGNCSRSLSCQHRSSSHARSFNDKSPWTIH